ncbi:MAG: AAA domain-containing protein [Crocinitomicaceae bacterium]|nr:AAA domain-containing protein [Crocinitomicaceae bacterium]
MKERLTDLHAALFEEEQEEKRKFKAAKLSQSINERIEKGTTLFPLEFRGSRFGRGKTLIFDFKFNVKRGYGEFSKSSPITLFSAKADHDYTGRITQFKEDEISINLELEVVPEWIREGKIGIDLRSDSKHYEVQKAGVKHQLEKPSRAIKALYSLVDLDQTDKSYNGDDLNASQISAIQDTLSERPLTIIHGPPGTGKTKTLVAATKEFVRRKQKVLLLATSNAAVDHLVRKVKEVGIQPIRLGNSPKISSDVFGNTLDELIRQENGYTAIQEMLKQKDSLEKAAFKFKRTFDANDRNQRNAARAEIRNLSKDIRLEQTRLKTHVYDKHPVFCSTVDSAAFSNSLKDFDFEAILIDEAGQATEPSIWSVSELGKKIVLAGDPYQLPPSINSPKAKNYGLDKSLLEIAEELEYPRNLLNVQYRMPKELIGFSNEFFYNNQLMSHTDSIAPIDEFSPIEFIDTAGSGFEETKSDSGAIYNEGELKIVEKRIESLSDFVVISPYRGQVHLLQDKLGLIDTQVNTVDSFQGQEKETIIISLVRSNENGTIGFLSEYRRMNVALTRAQKKLIVIGDSATIGNDKFYASFLNYVEKNGSYRSVWEFDLF